MSEPGAHWPRPTLERQGGYVMDETWTDRLGAIAPRILESLVKMQPCRAAIYMTYRCQECEGVRWHKFRGRWVCSDCGYKHQHEVYQR